MKKKYSFVLFLLCICSFSLAAQTPDELLERLAGTWQGDKGIDRVTLKQDGTGVVTFPHDKTLTMPVELVFQGSRISVRQKGANHYKYYTSVFSSAVARELVSLVRPMSWTFWLSSDGKTLEGYKETSYIRYNPLLEHVEDVDNTYSRDARWVRIP